MAQLPQLRLTVDRDWLEHAAMKAVLEEIRRETEPEAWESEDLVHELASSVLEFVGGVDECEAG